MATDLSRRALLGAGLGALATTRLSAQASTTDRFPIWPGQPPGAPAAPVRDVTVARSPTPGDIAFTSVGTPILSVARPAKPNGGAVLVIPGGGYARVAVRREPGETSLALAARGYHAFELLYRLPHDGWAAGPDAPLQDAQRAMRLIRAGAGARWAVDPTKVAAMGFSAGGHLAARLSSRAGLAIYAAVDAADRQSARPIATALFIPVVTMLDAGVHTPSRRELLGTHVADPAWQRRFSAQMDLPADMPPTWVCTNTDDRSVPPLNSVLMHQALVAAKVPTELHVFERGGHGFPTRARPGIRVPWLELFLDFAADHGLPA